MRSRWRLSVMLILASTSVATWLMVERQSGATADPSPTTAPIGGLVAGPIVGPVKPASITTAPTATAPTTEPGPLPGPPPKPDDTTAVKRGSLVLSFDFDGVFEPVDPFELKLKVRSYQGDFVVRKAIEPGTKVARGDLLLELDPQKIDVQIAAADNDVTTAQANLAKADSDVKLGEASDTLAMNNAKDDLGFAQTELKRWDATDGPANVLAGGMEGKQVQAALDDATDELNELKKMYKSEDLTNQTADIVMKRAARGVELQKLSSQISQAASDRAQNFTPKVARQHLATTVDQQTQAIVQLEATQTQAKVVRATALFTAKQAADEATRKLADLKQDRSNFSITSPIDGVVVYGAFAHKAWTETDRDKLAIDARLTADLVLMTVYTPGKLRVGTDWPEAQLTLLSPTIKTKVSPVAIPELSYDGTCLPPVLIGSAKGEEQAFDVTITLPPTDPRLVPGFKATVSVDAGKLDNVPLLPVTAVYRGKVWIHGPDGEDVPKSVTVGRNDGHMIEIKDGLTEGQSVLTQAKHPGAN